MTPTERVIAAASLWWQSHRPVQWTEMEHLDNPTINCLTDSDRRLAQAIADWLGPRVGSDTETTKKVYR